MIYCFVFGAEVATFLFAPNGQFTRATKNILILQSGAVLDLNCGGKQL
jgi:hypothetical protein